jgi:hypothetical protein
MFEYTRGYSEAPIGLLTCVTQQVEMESFNLLWFSPIRIAQS